MDPSTAPSVADGLVTGLFGYLLTIIVGFLTAGMVWAIVRTLGAAQQRAEARATAATRVAPAEIERMATADERTAHHVAAIAAAVTAVVGSARIVHIGDAGTGVGWRATGRTLVHTSHTPHLRRTTPH